MDHTNKIIYDSILESLEQVHEARPERKYEKGNDVFTNKPGHDFHARWGKISRFGKSRGPNFDYFVQINNQKEAPLYFWETELLTEEPKGKN